MVSAIVLSGSTNTGGLSQTSNASGEGMIEIHNKLMVEWVLEALTQSENIDNIVLVGLPDARQIAERWPDVKYAPAGDTSVKSSINGLEYVDKSQMVLVVTDDIPLLTAEAVDHFIDQCQGRQGDLFYPIITQQSQEKKYPGSVRTYVKFKDGVFTGGNIFFVNPKVVPLCADKVEEIVRLRKKPFDLCKLIGFGFVIKFLLKTLTINEAEKRVSSLLGLKGFTVTCPYPEVGIDVDKPSDLELVKQHLNC